MNVALLGSGGREHALAWKLSRSAGVSRLFCLPGNAGTMKQADNAPIDPTDIPAVLKFCQKNDVKLVVVGPEDPLAIGIADALAGAGIRVFGPTKDAARLEADKWFAKELMRSQSVPTAEAKSFTSHASARAYVEQREGRPMVVKAAGLAKGKGVTIAHTPEDALRAVDDAMKHKIFGEAGARVVFEELLSGPEISVMALVDKSSVYLLEPAQDHKPVFNGNTGPMTGGMGAFSPGKLLSDEVRTVVERDVIIPVLDGLRREGITYRGVLYVGLMLTHAGPKVLEFNVRFGDPETQPLMMRLQNDLLEVIDAVIDDRLDDITLVWDPRPAVCVVAASEGYPGKYPVDRVISGLEMPDSDDLVVFHSGTKRFGADTLTAGGRVLSVTALGTSLEEARARVYERLTTLRFQGMHVRTDIGSGA